MARLKRINTTVIQRELLLVNGVMKNVETKLERGHFDERELADKINELVDAINNLNDNVFK